MKTPHPILPASSGILLVSLGLICCIMTFAVTAVTAATAENMVSPFSPEVEPTNSHGIPFPTVRYIAWQHLSTQQLERAILLGYDEDSWNMPGGNDVENIRYDSLGYYGQGVVDALLQDADDTADATDYPMGRDQWDCYINHYRHSNWDELHDQGVRSNVRALGWTYDMWMNQKTVVPPCYEKLWNELSDAERRNATELCYFSHLWDGHALTIWGYAPVTPSPVPSPTNPPAEEVPTTTTSQSQVSSAPAINNYPAMQLKATAGLLCFLSAVMRFLC